MISLSDFQPLSICKINTFSSKTGVLRKDISVAKFYAILIEQVPVQTTLRDCVTSLKGLKFLDQPSNFVLNILTLTCNV